MIHPFKLFFFTIIIILLINPPVVYTSGPSLTISSSMLSIDKINEYFQMCNLLAPKYMEMFKKSFTNQQITNNINEFCDIEFSSYEKLLCKILVSNKDVLKLIQKSPNIKSICMDRSYLPFSYHHYL